MPVDSIPPTIRTQLNERFNENVVNQLANILIQEEVRTQGQNETEIPKRLEGDGS